MTIDCDPTFWSDHKEFLESFARRLQARRVPISGSIEITHRCNLKCVHCYLQGQRSQKGCAGQELDTDQWRRLIDEMTAAGCLYLLITGGEPLLRPDFKDIYQYARESGLLVTVFTNGTLVNKEIVDLFADLPPTLVEISLYGATAAVFERITGVTGSFENCMAGIRRLLAAGIETRLKTVLMNLNREEFGQIEEIAREFGIKFRFDPLIMPRYNGDKTPLDLRVSPEEAVKKDFADSHRALKWAEFFRKRSRPALDDRLYPCGAGLTSFHIGPDGILKPCLMALDGCYDIRQDGGFAAGWQGVIPGLREKKLPADSACPRCEARTLCGYCPPFFKLETGDEHRPPQYICDVGRLRLQAVKLQIAGD